MNLKGLGRCLNNPNILRYICSLSKTCSMFEVGFNATAVVYSLASWLVGIVCILIMNVKIEDDEYLAHMVSHAKFFFSVWGTALFSLYVYLKFAINIMEIKLKMNEDNTENSVKKIRKLKTISSYLFFTIVFPINATACVQFWGVYYCDRELIYPLILDKVFPFWINHALHTLPLPLAVYYAFQENVLPMKHTLSGTIGMIALYALCLTCVRLTSNTWIYHGLHMLTDDQRLRLLLLFAITVIYTSMMGTTLAKIGRGFRRSFKENWLG